MKDDRGELDLSALIDEHKKELWKYQMKESEWIKTQNQLDGTKRIVEELANKNVSLKKETEELKRDNKYLAQQVEDYREILKKAGL